MDIGATIVQAGRLIWQHKILVVVAVVAALASSMINLSVSLPQTFAPTADPMMVDPTQMTRLLQANLLLVCGALLLGVVTIALTYLARATVIEMVGQVNRETRTDLGEAFSVALGRAPRIFVIDFLLYLPVILIFVCGLVALFALVFGGVVAADQVRPEAAIGGIFGFIAAIFGLICAVILLTLLIGLIAPLMYQACVHDRLGVFAAMGRGWQVLRSNLGAAIVIWLALIVLAILVAVLLMPFSTVLAFITGGMGAAMEPGAAGDVLAPTALLFLCLGVPLAILGAVLGGIVEAYALTLWGLTYLQLRPAVAEVSTE